MEILPICTCRLVSSGFLVEVVGIANVHGHLNAQLCGVPRVGFQVHWPIRYT